MRKWSEIDSHLRHLSDEVAATISGRTIAQIRQRKILLGIAPNGKSDPIINWNEIDKDLLRQPIGIVALQHSLPVKLLRERKQLLESNQVYQQLS
jgi:hypothetical protein